MTRITVALDVDGVVSPVVDPEDPLHHERQTGWSFTSLEGVMLGSVVGDPVIQTLFDLGCAGVVERGGSDGRDTAAASGIEVLWHTSWWREAPESLAPALGLSALSGGIEKMFATEDEYLGKSHATWSSNWWKLAVVERWLREHPITPAGEHDLLIWVDDEIDKAVRSGEIPPQLLGDPRLVTISPALHVGLNADELALLRSLTLLDP